MLRKYLLFLLALVVVLQSGWSTAFAYELHQLKLESHQTNHTHEHATVKNAKNGHADELSSSGSTEQLATDCHQCGHCHGHNSIALVIHIPNVSPLPLAQALSDFLLIKTNNLPVSLFRPPR